MVQKVLPKGPRVLPPKCDFQKMRLGECSVHILRGPWISEERLEKKKGAGMKNVGN